MSDQALKTPEPLQPPPSPPEGAKKPDARTRRTRTREALLSAARRMMAHASPASFTVDDVVQAAAVAKGSFYNHFPDKEAIAHEVRRGVRELEEAEVQAINADVADPVARIARGMAVYARLALRDPEGARLLTLSRFEGDFLQNTVNAGLAADLRAALHHGRIVAPSIEAAAMLIVGQVAVLMARLSGDTASPLAHALAQQCIAITLIGIGLSHRDAQLLATQAVDAVLEPVRSRRKRPPPTHAEPVEREEAPADPVSAASP